MSKGENLVKWIKGQRLRWLGDLERMEEDRMPKKIFTQKTGRDEKKGKTQEKMERGSRKRSSCAGSEKMERVGFSASTRRRRRRGGRRRSSSSIIFRH